MILYFSGTGNSAYVAKRIGKEVMDDVINLFEKIRFMDHCCAHLCMEDTAYCTKLDREYRIYWE